MNLNGKLANETKLLLLRLLLLLRNTCLIHSFQNRVVSNYRLSSKGPRAEQRAATNWGWSRVYQYCNVRFFSRSCSIVSLRRACSLSSFSSSLSHFLFNHCTFISSFSTFFRSMLDDSFTVSCWICSNLSEALTWHARAWSSSSLMTASAIVLARLDFPAILLSSNLSTLCCLRVESGFGSIWTLAYSWSEVLLTHGGESWLVQTNLIRLVGAT